MKNHHPKVVCGVNDQRTLACLLAVLMNDVRLWLWSVSHSEVGHVSQLSARRSCRCVREAIHMCQIQRRVLHCSVYCSSLYVPCATQ